jgi:hypothetical protein
MSDTPSLFDPCGEFAPEPPAQWHSDTSRDAADQIATVAGRLRRTVYQWLAGRGAQGGTDEEIQGALSMPANTQRPRRVELFDQGLVVDSGRRRETRSGRKAVVWVVRQAS